MTSKTTVNMVVGLLGLALLACIGGAIALTATGDKVPDQLWTIGSTALGALAAVLVSTRSGDPVVAPAALQEVPSGYSPTLDAPLPVEDHAA